MWFSTWARVATLLAAGTLAYVAVVLILRVSGKRTLAKLNAFDFVVTVALGSTLATATLSRDVAVVEAVAALALLVTLQFVVALLSSRSSAMHTAVTSRPTALLVNGTVQDHALSRARMTRSELDAAVRQRGVGTLADIALVVLETDGSLSVVVHRGDGSALGDVQGA